MTKSKKKILVIEDDAFLRTFWDARLDPLYYEVIQASNGVEGLALAKSELPDLILLDILMPEMNGFEFLKIAKSEKTLKKIPIIILSNIGKAEEVRKGSKLGAVDYIIKSDVLPTEIESKIVKYLKKTKK